MRTLSDQEFQAWLDALERGDELPPTLPAEDAADLALAVRLFALRSRPDPGLAHRIRQNMGAVTFPHRRPSPVWRWAALGGVTILAVTLALSLTPAGVWAQEVFRRLGIAFLPGVPPQWREVDRGQEITRYFFDETQARAAAGFPLRWPTDLPFDRSEVALSGFVVQDGSGAWLSALYADDERRYLEVQVFWRRRPGSWPAGKAAFQPVTVAGHEGLWAERLPRAVVVGEIFTLSRVGPEGSGILQPGGEAVSDIEEVNALLWQEGEALYVLIDPERRFTLEDLLAVALSAYESAR